MKIHYSVKKVETYPAEWKVYPKSHPHWERNDIRFYFRDRDDALKYASELNTQENGND